MVKMIHLSPEERKEIIDNIVVKLEKRLTDVVLKIVGEYAITEADVIDRVRKEVEFAADQELRNRLRFRWLRWLFFK